MRITLLLACFGASALAQSAQAQRPVITQNVEEPGRTAYQHTLNATCLPSGFATIDFKPIDAGKRLVVTYFSAETAPLNSGPVLAFLDYVNGGVITSNGEFAQYPPQYIIPMNAVRPGLVVARETMTMVIPSSGIPDLTVSNCFGNVQATVVGYLVSYP